MPLNEGWHSNPSTNTKRYWDGNTWLSSPVPPQPDQTKQELGTTESNQAIFQTALQSIRQYKTALTVLAFCLLIALAIILPQLYSVKTTASYSRAPNNSKPDVSQYYPTTSPTVTVTPDTTIPTLPVTPSTIAYSPPPTEAPYIPPTPSAPSTPSKQLNIYNMGYTGCQGIGRVKLARQLGTANDLDSISWAYSEDFQLDVKYYAYDGCFDGMQSAPRRYQ